MNDLSSLKPVALDQGKAQWVQGMLTGIAKDNPIRTHTVGIPHLMRLAIAAANNAQYVPATQQQKVAA